MRHVKAVTKTVPAKASIVTWWKEINTEDPVTGTTPKEDWIADYPD